VKKAKIQHFKEVIPSANDIFIKSVKENWLWENLD
jgi:hypothetical protein